MRNFANVIRLPQPEPVFTSLNQVLKEAAQLMRPKAKKLGIVILLELDEDFNVQIDVKQIEQVLVNVINKIPRRLLG